MRYAIKYTKYLSIKSRGILCYSTFYNSQSLHGHFIHLLQVTLVLLDFLFSYSTRCPLPLYHFFFQYSIA